MPESRKLRFISLFVYGGVVVLLVYLAFFARGFSQSVGQMRLTGHYTAFPLFGKRIRDLTIGFHGISLVFSRSRPLTVTSQAGATTSSTVLSVRTFSDEAEIIFEDGPTIRITTGGSPSSYTISMDVSGLKAATIGIPCALRGQSPIADGASVVSWKEGNQSFLLSLPEGSHVDLASGELRLSAGSPTLQLHASAVEPSLSDPYASLLSIEASLVSHESLQKALDAFLDAAYIGWTRDRVTAVGAWKKADGTAGFSEEIGEALISESIPRGNYPKDRAVYQQALAVRLGQTPQEEFSLSSSPFIGNLREFQRRGELREAEEVDRIRGLLSGGSLEVLKLDYPVIPFLLDHGPFSLVQSTIDTLRNASPPQNDTAAALGMVESFMDFTAYVDRAGTDLSLCRAAIEKGILPFIRDSGGGIFLTDGKGVRVDVKQSLRAASLLSRASEILSLPVLASIARSLTASSIALARDSGFLPASLKLSANAKPLQEGSLAPESVHRFLAAGRFIPRETPLYTSLGPGTWIWSAADVESVNASPESFRIALKFPVGMPHYVMIQGIAQFQTVMLHGISWRSDPEYAQYSDGWMYDPQKKTVYLKLTGRQETEQIAFIN